MVFNFRMGEVVNNHVYNQDSAILLNNNLIGLINIDLNF